jgi:hypothetical protein
MLHVDYGLKSKVGRKKKSKMRILDNSVCWRMTICPGNAVSHARYRVNIAEHHIQEESVQCRKKRGDLNFNY